MNWCGTPRPTTSCERPIGRRPGASREDIPELAYSEYVATGTPEQQRRWTAVHEAATLAPRQQQLLKGFVRQMNLLVVSGIWCGDCVQQVSLLDRVAEAAAGRILLRVIERDQHRDLAEKLRINGGDRVPVALMLAED